MYKSFDNNGRKKKNLECCKRSLHSSTQLSVYLFCGSGLPWCLESVAGPQLTLPWTNCFSPS